MNDHAHAPSEDLFPRLTLFGKSLVLALLAYFAAEGIFTYCSKLLAPAISTSPHDDHALQFSVLATVGSAAAGLIFVAFRHRIRFSARSNDKSPLARRPRSFAVASGLCLGTIVLTTAYFFANRLLSILQIAVLLRSGMLVASWIVDQFHRYKRYVTRASSLRETLAVIAAVLAIAFSSISIRGSSSEWSMWALLLLVVYYSAYTARLHFMNRFKQLDLLRTPDDREAYFSLEQFGFAIIAMLFAAFAVAKVDWSGLSLVDGVEMGMSGVIYGVAGIAGVAILANPSLSATRAGLFTRLTGLAATTFASLAAYVWLGGLGPMPCDFFALVCFVFACVLLAAGQREREGAPASDGLGFGSSEARLAGWIVVVYLMTERLAVNARLVVTSPLASDVNVFALVGETLIQGAIAVLPLLLGIGAVFIALHWSSMTAELRAAFARDQPMSITLSSTAGSGRPDRASLAVQRLGWIVAAATGTVALITGVLGVPSKGAESTKRLEEMQASDTVREGRHMLTASRDKDSASCRFCVYVRAHSIRELDQLASREGTAAALTPEQSAQWTKLEAVLQLAESVLNARRRGELPETTFHSLWAPLVHDVCREVAWHYQHSEGLRAFLEECSPLVVEQAKHWVH